MGKREIKFRARLKTFFNRGTTYESVTYKWVYYEPSDGLPEIDENQEWMHGQVEEQYTSLKDKNGKEIYEGDWINFTYWWFDGNEAESNLCGEVVYIPELMSFGLKHVKNSDWCKHTGANRKVGDIDSFATWHFEDADFEIIGNIHENPELLTQEVTND